MTRIKKLFLLSLLFCLGTNLMGQSDCNLSNYTSAYIINANDYPYTSPGTGITISATWPGVSTLSNFSYSCNGQTFNTASPAWWLNSSSQVITLNFSAPVSSFSVVFNGTNNGEEFYFGASSGTVSVSNYCTAGYTAINSGTGLLYSGSSTSGSLVTITHSSSETTFTLRHNGVGSGSRIAVLDCIVPGSTLPVSLTSFDVSCENGKKTVHWTTATETNNDYFTIERSFDAESFKPVGNVEGAGNSNSERSYIWTDDEEYTGEAYYRLKQTDYDGKYSYSDISQIECAMQKGSFSVFPNPVETFLGIRKAPELKILNYSITDIAGNVVMSKTTEENSPEKINVNDLPAGVYFISCTSEQGVRTEKFIKR